MNTKRASVVISLFSAALLVIACDKPGETAQKKQGEAKQELTQAELEASKKVINANAEANRNVDQAQATAEQKVQKANADFQLSVATYRTTRQKDLADLDKSITELSVKAVAATGATRVALDKALPDIRNQRENIGRVMRTVDDATPANFDATKVTVDKAFDDLTATIKKVS